VGQVKASRQGTNKNEMLQVLYEQWVQAGGKWDSSQLVIQARTCIKGSKTGARRWMMRSEIVKRYGCEATADELILVKESDPTLLRTQVRNHPELPHRRDLRLYLCWDESYETDTEDVLISKRLEVAQKDSPRRGRSKEKKDHKKKDKKRKRSTSSSSSSKRQSSSSSQSSKGSADSDSSSSKRAATKATKKSKKSKKSKDGKSRRGSSPTHSTSTRLSKEALKNAEKQRQKDEEQAEKKRQKEEEQAEKKRQKDEENAEKKRQKDEENEKKKLEKEKKQQAEKEKQKQRASGKKAGGYEV